MNPLRVRLDSCLLGALVLLTVPPPVHASSPPSADRNVEPSVSTAELRATLDEWLPERMRRYRVPGVVAAIVKSGESLLVEGYGLAVVEDERPMTARTVVRVGSVSKAVTATLALVAVERGEMGLHDDLRPLLADLPLRPAFDRPLTLHHLLTFTGGFDERLIGQHTRAASEHAGLGEWLRKNVPPRFAAPGVVSSYNDFQTSLAGLALARVADEEFPELARREVLQHLEMHDSSFEQVSLGPEMLNAMARSYEFDESSGSWRAYPRDYIQTTPAAGLFTTAQDMAHYLEALTGGRRGRALLDQQEWRRQFRRQWSADPQLPAWGYGFAQSRREGHEVWYKDGQASGFQARVLIVPDLSFAAFFAHNRNIIGPGGRFPPASRLLRELGDLLLERHLPREQAAEIEEPVPRHPRPSSEDASPLTEALPGTYRTTIQSRHTIERLIAMFEEVRVEAGGDDAISTGGLRFVEVGPGLYQYADGGPHYVGFVRGPDGSTYFYPYGSRTAYELVPPLFTARISVAVILAATLIAICMIPGSIALTRRARGSTARWTARIAGAHGVLLSTGVLLALGTLRWGDAQRLFQGATVPLQAGLVAMPASVAALVLLAALSLRGLRSVETDEAAWIRVLPVLYALLQFGSLPWLVYWQFV